MKKFRVRYWIKTLMETVVEAETEESAFDVVAIGPVNQYEKVIKEHYDEDDSCEEVKLCQ